MYKLWIFIHTFTPNSLIWVSVAQIIRYPTQVLHDVTFAIALNNPTVCMKTYTNHQSVDNSSKYCENWGD